MRTQNIKLRIEDGTSLQVPRNLMDKDESVRFPESLTLFAISAFGLPELSAACPILHADTVWTGRSTNWKAFELIRYRVWCTRVPKRVRARDICPSVL